MARVMRDRSLFRGVEGGCRVALSIAFRERELEYRPQVPSQMSHDAAGQRFGLGVQECLQFPSVQGPEV